MTSGGASFGHLTVIVGGDWCTHLSTYDDHSPILDIDAGSTSVSFSVTGPAADDAAVKFARELAAQATRFAAEVERLHAQPPVDTDQACEDEARDGEAA
jgi:hypothetical protein